MVAGTELPIDSNATAMQMAQSIFGNGVTVVSATYTGDDDSSGIYSSGDAISPSVTPADTGVILSTGHVDDFTNDGGDANQNSNTSTDTSGPDGNAGLGANSFDAAILDMTFIPTGDTLTLQFVFASEEYPEYQSSQFQDFVTIEVNGQDVPLGVGDGDTDPSNINGGTNQNFYIDNSSSQHNTEMDGFTVTLTLKFPVTPGQESTLRIGVADVADSSYDSALLIAADSAQTALIATDDTASVFTGLSTTIDVLGNDTAAAGATLTVTHINGQSVVAGSVVTLATGDTVTVNADGTLKLTGDGSNGDFDFSYTVSDGTNSDTAFVNATESGGVVPCFVNGTLIETSTGPRKVEELQVGDMVLTQDNGYCPIRWIDSHIVQAQGRFAPIEFQAGALGDHGRLCVSPEHRILVRDAMAEVLFGETEVLVAAKMLVNDITIRRKTGADVTYVHFMFDDHQIVFSEGIASESYLPGPQTSKNCAPETLKELQALFPALDVQTGAGYSPAARRTLKSYEAQMLMRA